MRAFDSVKIWARRIKRDSVTLWFAYRHPDTPSLVKALCIAVVAYALSPIDLIPDFIPVLGLLDDAILLPALIWVAVRSLPVHVLASSRVAADEWMAQRKTRPRSYAGAAFIVSVWVVTGLLLWRWFA